tara:strand:+ start:111 stop:710 length:600 start_codon:yes stop_codon:yes gene_type:complete
MNKSKLIEFETKIANLFNNAKIKAPVHLYSNNEDKLIKIFKKITNSDWVFCSWRSHYQCLLKGVPDKVVEKEILEGKSISLCFPEYKVYSSAIVGGVIPIATGVALSNKLKKNKSKVFCFVGEMTAETGIMHECLKFSISKKLPIHFIVEDNGKSVCTNTRKTWSKNKLSFDGVKNKYVSYYRYKLKYPHAGAGKRVQF